MYVDFALILMTRDTQYTLTKVTSSKLLNTYFSSIFLLFTSREAKLKNLMTHSREWFATNHPPSTATNTHYIPLLEPHTQQLLLPCWVLESQDISMRKKSSCVSKATKIDINSHSLRLIKRTQNFNLFFSFAVVIS